MTSPLITVSVVSHAQNALVNLLLPDLARHCAGTVALVLTENVPDAEPLQVPAALPAERIVNRSPKGFGANHNAAFARCRTELFCVANPDIRLPADPFPPLRGALAAQRAAVAGPLVRSEQGSVEDSARRYPTFGSLVRKALSRDLTLDYASDRGRLEVDW